MVKTPHAKPEAHRICNVVPSRDTENVRSESGSFDRISQCLECTCCPLCE